MTDGADSQRALNDDLKSLTLELSEIQKIAGVVFSEIETGFSDAIVSGKSFEDALSNITKQLGELALNFATDQISNGLSSLLDSIFGSGSSSAAGTASNDVVSEILSTFTTHFAGQPGSAAPVNVNIQTPDAGSFKNTEQNIAAMFAKAVQRGQRNL